MADIREVEIEVTKIVNIERRKAGLPLLKLSIELCRMARFKSQDMIDEHYFAHVSPKNGDLKDLLRKHSIYYLAAGENIACGQSTAIHVMECWMNSPGHRANILDANFTEIGVGFVIGGIHQYYWTQIFRRK